MGYHITQGTTSFIITSENKEPAMKAIQALPDGSINAWVSQYEIESATTLEEVMSACRWDVDADGDGKISMIEFTGQKLGDDELLFQTIAPYVGAGSFIVITGEEDSIWRWFFTGTSLEEQNGRLVFDAN